MTTHIALKPRILVALSLATAGGVVAPSAIQSAFATPSPIANLALPGSAALLNNRTLQNSLGRFLMALAIEQKLKVSDAKNAELFWWKGEAYKSGRASFWRSAFRKSLQSAGYRYREFDSHDIVTNIYEQQYGLSAFDDGERVQNLITISMGDTQNYFVAAHPQTGATYIGMWLDQEQAGQCILAIQQVGASAPIKQVSLPPVSGANVLLVKDPRNVMKGIVPPKNPPLGTVRAKPRYARGIVKTISGKPVAGATISVQSSAAGGLRTSVTTKTNAQGLYEVPLPMGVCQVVDAYCRVLYNGRPYFLPLHSVDGNLEVFNSTQGHVENFVLRTWGVADSDHLAQYPESGEAYYGASLRVQWFLDGLPETGTVEVTLKPQGPLLDGSAGRTFVIRFPAKGDSIINVEHYINNIPLGRYILTARVLDDGDAMPMRVERVFESRGASEAMTIDFKSSGTGYATLNRSGTERLDVIFKP